MLFPIIAPLPAWAYELNLPAAPIEAPTADVSLPDLSLDRIASAWNGGVATLTNLLGFFIGSSAKSKKASGYSPAAAARRVKSIQTQLQPETRVYSGSALSLSALPLDAKGQMVDGLQPKWKTSNRRVLEVSGTSEAVAQMPGEATLTVEYGNAKSEYKVIVEAKPQAESGKAAAMLPPTDEMIIDALFSAQNNIGSPPGQVEAEAMRVDGAIRTKERVGSSNYSFNVPIASLPGRGIDAGVGLTYNSRLWTKVLRQSPQPHDYYYNVDRNWNLSPGMTLGYGHLDNFVASGTTPANFTYRFSLVRSDGTRSELSLKQSLGGLRIYESTDGSFVQMEIWSGGEASAATLELKYPDGTVVTYGVRTPDHWQNHGHQGRRYPMKITNRNGNTISITYRQADTYGKIDTITDTLGRTIKFEYNSSEFLVAITVPPLVENEPRRQAIRFYYTMVNFTTGERFSDGGWTYPGFETPSVAVVNYVYFPGTGTGFKFNYSSAWGVIYQILNLRGMTVSTTALDNTGYVTYEGTTAASTTYDYPLTLTDTTQPAPLADVPKFNTKTDQWLPDNTPHVTTFSIFNSPTDSHKISRIKTPDNVVSESWAAITSDWQNGLVTDTYIKTLGQLTDTVWAHSKMHWTDAGTSGRRNPRVTKVEETNSAGQMKPTTFEYDSYNNQTVVRRFDYGVTDTTPGGELRKTETTYVTGSAWTARNLFRLPQIVKRWTNGILSSRTEYAYDATAMDHYSEEYISGLDPRFNPNTPPGEVCYERCPSACENDPQWPQFCMCPMETVCYPEAIYDATTAYRGNVTKVTAWADPSNDTDPDKTESNFEYDITGNVIEAANLNCCNLKTIEYDEDYHYAYPTREIKGSSGLQLTTEADYNFRTGFVTATRDENSQETDYTYDAATMRQTRIDRPDGGWETTEFNETTFPYHVKKTNAIDSTRSLPSWIFYDGAARSFRTRELTANGYLSTDVEFNEIGIPIRKYNPYTVSGITDARPSGIKFTEGSEIDALGRFLEITFPDETITTVAFNNSVSTPSGFNRTFMTTTDQAGKQRRQLFDALGRLVRVDEADTTSGSLGSVSSPNQPTSYEYDGNNNLTKTTQSGHSVTQERVFKYNGLSQLTHERQVEANATLNDSGVKVTSGGLWTGFYKYAANGQLDYGVDARGVKTDFTYDALNRVTEIGFADEVGYTTPTTRYTYSEAETGFRNVGRLTRISTDENSGQGTPATEHNYDYDAAGQIKKHIQKITAGSDIKTYQLQYGYNYAGHLVSETYPSGRVVTSTIDHFGVTQTVADSQRTYLSGVTINNQGLLSQVTLGNGTSETFTWNDRAQLTSQSLLRSSAVLQKFDYSFGQVNTSNGNVDQTKNNGQLAKVEGWIGSSKQWSQRFGYDEVGRLEEAREHRGDNDSLTFKQIFEYDRFGNLYRKASTNPTTGQSNPIPFTPIEDADINKAKNRFASGTTYDDSGSVTQDAKFRSLNFNYDANGRVTKITASGVPDASSLYDGLGNRVGTKTNGVWQYMIYDANGLLVSEYGTLESGVGGANYVQADWQGSIRTVTNSNGYVVARIDHQAFGENVGAGVGLRTIAKGYGIDPSIRHGYALTENDKPSGLQHTWFRKLETQAGRWTSADPYLGSMQTGDPQTLNKYSYVRSEPTNFNDPSGLMMQICGTIDDIPVCFSFGGGSYPYYGAQNGYQAANAMAGGFFGGSVSGYLEGRYAGRMHLENDQYVYAYYVNFYASFDGYFGSGGRGGNGEEPENPENNNPPCDRAAQRQLREDTIREERRILREEFNMSWGDYLEGAATGAVCGAAAYRGAKSGVWGLSAKICGAGIAKQLGYKFAAATARITALNVSRLAKEYEMGCGEMGVIKGWLS